MVGSLKALDPNRPIREADIDQLLLTRRGAMKIKMGAPLWNAPFVANRVCF